eukprot:4628365-Pleurochrysis_carterae.AAC.4
MHARVPLAMHARVPLAMQARVRFKPHDRSCLCIRSEWQAHRSRRTPESFNCPYATSKTVSHSCRQPVHASGCSSRCKDRTKIRQNSEKPKAIGHARPSPEKAWGGSPS